MDLQKIKIIIKREYVTRVRTKAFIISTILAPVAIILLIGIPIILQLFDTEKKRIIGVVDEVGSLYYRLDELSPDRYKLLEPITDDSLRSLVLNGKIDGYLVLTEAHVQENSDVEFLSGGTGGIGLITGIQSDVRSALRDERLDRAEVGEQVRDILSMRASLVARKITIDGDESQNTLALFIVGYIMCFIIYGAMFGYGAIIMRSVIEEKTSRIVEIITSSAKPFELLLGKVIGVGALGLTQFTIWAVTAGGLLSIAGPLAALTMKQDTVVGDSGEVPELPFEIPVIGAELWINFILFFLMGYLIYSALFAAVGSAVDSESDSQQLVLPITLPIILPILFLERVASDPESSFAVITSMIPFFAPILMPVRIAMSDVPFWQYGLVYSLLILTFLGLIWVSSRIYRVGILMYGKKASFKEMARWVRFN